jgi:hypothetical protein
MNRLSGMPPELPPEEARFLAEHGGIDITRSAEEADRAYTALVLKTAEEFARGLLTTGQMAAKLHLSTSTVRRRADSGALFAFMDGSTRLLPAWQIFKPGDGDWKTIPHLTDIVQAFRPDMHPFSISAIMTLPQPELTISPGVQVTPSEWLAQGHSPKPVVAILSREPAW